MSHRLPSIWISALFSGAALAHPGAEEPLRHGLEHLALLAVFLAPAVVMLARRRRG